jgi:hypothetical protein
VYCRGELVNIYILVLLGRIFELSPERQWLSLHHFIRIVSPVEWKEKSIEAPSAKQTARICFLLGNVFRSVLCFIMSGDVMMNSFSRY